MKSSFLKKRVIERMERTFFGKQVLNFLKILTPYRLKKMSTVEQKTYWNAIAKNFKEADYITILNPDEYIRFNNRIILDNIQALDIKSILEVGSGNGGKLSLLRTSFPDKFLVGCDFVEEQLRIAKQLFFKDNTVGLVCCNATFLPFKSNSFDLIFTSLVLMYVSHSDINRVIAEFKRVSKKYLLLVEPYLKHMPLTNKIEYLGLNFVYMHDYERILERHGFQKIKVFGIPDKNNRCRYSLFLYKKSRT